MTEPTKLAAEVAGLLLKTKNKVSEEDNDDGTKYRDLNIERSIEQAQQFGVVSDVAIEESSDDLGGQGYEKDQERSFNVVTNKKNASKEVGIEVELDVDGREVEKSVWKQPAKDTQKKSREALFSLAFLKNATTLISKKLSVAKNADVVKDSIESTVEKSQGKEQSKDSVKKESAVKSMEIGSLVKEIPKIAKDEIKIETKESVINPGENSHDTTKITTKSLEVGEDGKINVKAVETSQLGEYEVKKATLGDLKPSSTPEVEGVAKDLGKEGAMER